MGSLLKETMSEVLLTDGYKFYDSKTLVSIINVNITPDLSVARFYISIFNADDSEVVLQKFKDHDAELRGLLGNKLRNHLRKIPDIEFYIDDSLEYAQKMNEIFEKIKNDSKSK
jgi:ribosome-binding factor A